MAIEPQLHARIKLVCKKHLISVRHLMRDAVIAYVGNLEEEDRVEEERLVVERQKKKQIFDPVQQETPTKFSSFKKLSNAIFAPLKKPGSIEKQPDDAETETEYDKHAQKIFEALLSGSTMEVRLCTAEAVEAIKKRYPLTHPPDEAIIIALEKLVVEKRNAVRQEIPEQVVDVTRIKTRRGNVDTPPTSSDVPKDTASPEDNE